MNSKKYNFKQIHSECGWHEKEVLASSLCGCFHCQEIFPAGEIAEWIDEPEDCPRGPGRTALCPKCDIDAVLPEGSLYEITPDLLKEMNRYYFS